MIELAGKVAFITGGSSGIGLGIARAFADAGMCVVLTYRTPAHLEEAMQCLSSARDRIHAIRVDVTDRAGLERAAQETIKRFDAIHVLVNNAGAQLPVSLEETSYADWDRLIEVNLSGVFNGIHTFLPRIKAHGQGGHILTTASIVGLVVPHAGFGAYYASKFAVVGLMEALRADLAGTNIGVSMLCPGPVKSNLEDRLKTHPMSLDPFEVGRFALHGMRHNELYILTHPEFAPLFERRNQALAASLAKGPGGTEAGIAILKSLLPDCIYKTT